MSKQTAQVFTAEELATIGAAAQRVWSEIAGDIFEATDESAFSKADVIELVMDASRLEDQLRRTKGVDKDLVARVELDVYAKQSVIEQHLKTAVFRHAEYGM